MEGRVLTTEMHPELQRSVEEAPSAQVAWRVGELLAADFRARAGRFFESQEPEPEPEEFL